MQVFLPARGIQHPIFFAFRRFQSIRLRLLALRAALALSPLLCFALPPANDPPSVVLITIDTVRSDHLRCYGYNLTDHWQWCPSGSQPINLGTLIDVVHKDHNSQRSYHSKQHPSGNEYLPLTMERECTSGPKGGCSQWRYAC